MSLISLTAIGLGAVLGAWLRWVISLGLNNHVSHIPLGTLTVNLLGALVVGFATAWFANSDLNANAKLFIITGFCGALTTFSTFSIEVVTLLQSGKYVYAVMTISLHVVGSLLLTLLGILGYQLTLGQ